MIETIKLSAKHKSQLTTIKRRTGVEKLECNLSLGFFNVS